MMLFHQCAETLSLHGVVRRKLTELDVVEDLLLGQGGHAETGAGHAPVCQTGRKMSSDLSLNAGFQLFDRLKKSAVLVKRGIDFRLAEAHSGVRETLRRAGFEKQYGPIEHDQTVSTVLSRWNHSSTAIPN
jgi:hypothetical protein